MNSAMKYTHDIPMAEMDGQHAKSIDCPCGTDMKDGPHDEPSHPERPSSPAGSIRPRTAAVTPLRYRGHSSIRRL